jgi:hypothetical protein
MAPTTIHAMMLILFLHPQVGLLTRLLACGPSIPGWDLVPNVVGVMGRDDNVRMPSRNNGMSSPPAWINLQSICDDTTARRTHAWDELRSMLRLRSGVSDYLDR